jgi:hypothetical protein
MAWTTGLTAVLVTTSSIVLAGCGSDGSADAPATSSLPPTCDAADATRKGAQLEFAVAGINMVVSASHAGIVGTITRATGVRWNSDDGSEWNGTNEVSPYPLRVATVAVEQVLFDSPTLTVDPGQQIDVAFDVYQGESIGGIPAEVPPRDAFGGCPRTGERILALLRDDPVVFGTDATPKALIGPTNGYLGIWRFQDDQAVSADPARTVDVDRLIARVDAEHRRGQLLDATPEEIAADQAIYRNPLGEGPTATTRPVPPSPTTAALAPSATEIHRHATSQRDRLIAERLTDTTVA